MPAVRQVSTWRKFVHWSLISPCVIVCSWSTARGIAGNGPLRDFIFADHARMTPDPPAIPTALDIPTLARLPSTNGQQFVEFDCANRRHGWYSTTWRANPDLQTILRWYSKDMPPVCLSMSINASTKTKQLRDEWRKRCRNQRLRLLHVSTSGSLLGKKHLVSCSARGHNQMIAFVVKGCHGTFCVRLAKRICHWD